DVAILEGSRLRLIGVDCDVGGLGVVFRDEAPLEPGVEAGASAAAQVGLFHLVDYLRRRHLQRFLQGLVAAAAPIGFAGVRARLVRVARDELLDRSDAAISATTAGSPGSRPPAGASTTHGAAS